VTPQLKLFRDLSADCLAHVQAAGKIPNLRDAPLATRLRLDEAQIRAYGRMITTFAEFCAEQGVPLGFHRHMAAAIETEPTSTF